MSVCSKRMKSMLAVASCSSAAASATRRPAAPGTPERTYLPDIRAAAPTPTLTPRPAPTPTPLPPSPYHTLADYPRPAGDDGYGFHINGSPYPPSVDQLRGQI